jgi:hypothetical protein
MVIDACYAWQLRKVIGRQSQCELASLSVLSQGDHERSRAAVARDK